MSEAENTDTPNRVAPGNGPVVQHGGPDADLLAACASFHAIEDRRSAIDRAGNVSDELGRSMDDEWDDAFNAVSVLKPRAPEGVRARAGVAFVAFRGVVANTEASWQEEANKFEFLALDALADAAGIAITGS